jgi:hypothetical protein
MTNPADTLLLDGRTPIGTHVAVWAIGGDAMTIRLLIDGLPVAVHHVDVFRDGGTRMYITDAGNLVFPRRAGTHGRAPHLNEQPIA